MRGAYPLPCDVLLHCSKFDDWELLLCQARHFLASISPMVFDNFWPLNNVIIRALSQRRIYQAFLKPEACFEAWDFQTSSVCLLFFWSQIDSFHLLGPRTSHAKCGLGVDNVSPQTELPASHRDEYHTLGGHFPAFIFRVPGQYKHAGACWPWEALPAWG